LYEIQRKRKAIEALTLRGQVDEVARLSQQVGPLFERARELGIEPLRRGDEAEEAETVGSQQR